MFCHTRMQKFRANKTTSWEEMFSSEDATQGVEGILHGKTSWTGDNQRAYQCWTHLHSKRRLLKKIRLLGSAGNT